MIVKEEAHSIPQVSETLPSWSAWQVETEFDGFENDVLRNKVHWFQCVEVVLDALVDSGNLGRHVAICDSNDEITANPRRGRIVAENVTGRIQLEKASGLSRTNALEFLARRQPSVKRAKSLPARWAEDWCTLGVQEHGRSVLRRLPSAAIDLFPRGEPHNSLAESAKRNPTARRTVRDTARLADLDLSGGWIYVYKFERIEQANAPSHNGCGRMSPLTRGREVEFNPCKTDVVNVPHVDAGLTVGR